LKGIRRHYNETKNDYHVCIGRFVFDYFTSEYTGSFSEIFVLAAKYVTDYFAAHSNIDRICYWNLCRESMRRNFLEN